MLSLRKIKRTVLRRLGLMPPRHRAYVGPGVRYEASGPYQLELLRALGLLPHHYLLDLGCGSLAAGRVIIPYLEAGHYFGIEPEVWLVEDGIRFELGGEVFRAKRPRFSHGRDFDLTVFGRSFDFILAHSVMSHTAPGELERVFASADRVMAAWSLFAASFVEAETDYQGDRWVYPGLTHYRYETMSAMAARNGLECERVAWRGRQQWIVLFRAVNRPATEARLAALAAQAPRRN